MKRGQRWLSIALLVACALLGAFWRLQVDRKERSAEPRDQRPAITAAERRARVISPEVATGLSGTVRGDGKPLAGAAVCAACVACEATGAPPSPCTTSDLAGRYSFADLAPEGYFISATADGWIPGTAAGGRPVILERAQVKSGVDIELEGGGARLHGMIADATGGPVPHARVRAIRLEPPRLSMDVVTDAEGSFVMSLLPGFIELIAEADGYVPTRAGFVAPRDDVELRLTPAGSLQGRVVAAAGGQPVPGIEVRALPLRNQNTPNFRSALSNTDGTFVLEGLEPGSYALRARGDGWRGESNSSIELGLAESISDIQVEVSAAANVIGRVLIEPGTPCPMGKVALGDPDPIAPIPKPEHPMHLALGDEVTKSVGPEQVARIAADGSVSFLGVPPGFYFVRVDCAEHVLRDGPRTLQVGSEDQVGLTWSVAPAGRLRVRVVDGRGQPVARGSFKLRWPDPGGDRGRGFTVFNVDETGSTELTGLRPGSYDLEPASGEARGRLVTVELREGAAKTEVTLELLGSGMIMVEAKTAQGMPVDDLRISARAIAQLGPGESQPAPPEQARPLGQGQFRIGPLERGLYVVNADDGINPPLQQGEVPGTEIQVADGSVALVRLEVPLGATIAGRVLDELGARAANVWVEPKYEASATSAPRISFAIGIPKRALTDSEGGFVLDGLAPEARYTLRASEPYGSSAVVRGVVPGGQVEIRLPRPGAIAGVVVDANDEPIPNFAIRSQESESGAEQQKTIADREGRFALRGIAPGTVQLTVMAARGPVATHTVELAAGQQIEGLRISVQPSPELTVSEVGDGTSQGFSN